MSKLFVAVDLVWPFDGTPGKLNSTRDVSGVEVGYTTLIRWRRKTLDLAKGPCARGVTAIVIPRGHNSLTEPVLRRLFQAFEWVTAK